ncbi:MAG: hypothetical protein IK104_10835 [Clostridia bacterium]|nr:hypothetical protein [Clostridia bacterium]
MAIQQLTAFVENRRGRLVEITRMLAAAGVDMRALSIADTQEFGILRVIVDDTETAEKTLRSEGVLVRITPVVGVRLTDRPGELSRALTALDDAGINVEYLYAFLAVTPGIADMVLRVKDNEAAEKALTEAGFDII